MLSTDTLPPKKKFKRKENMRGTKKEKKKMKQGLGVLNLINHVKYLGGLILVLKFSYSGSKYGQQTLAI